MNIGKINQLTTERPVRPLRRHDLERQAETVERQQISLLTVLAEMHPHKVLELADRIKRQALSEETS